MLYTRFSFDHDDIVSDGYCDDLEVEIQVKSYDGVNADYEIVEIYNNSQAKFMDYETLPQDAQVSLDLLCRRIAIDEAHEAYREYIRNSQNGGEYD